VLSLSLDERAVISEIIVRPIATNRSNKSRLVSRNYVDLAKSVATCISFRQIRAL